MELSLLLIIIGIVLVVLNVSYTLGILCVVIGLVLLIWPRLTASRRV